jgi:CARDB protein
VTFNPALPIYTSECGGLHGHVKVAPDGTVYVPNKGCGGHQGVVVSEDNGLTWSVRTVSESGSGDWDPSVALASDGTAYLGYGDADGHPKVAVSHDQGRSWTNVRDVGVPFSIAHTAFASMVAGDGDRAALAFLGTSEPSAGAFGDNPSWGGVWHLYIATTYDGGNTWTTVDATPTDAVQRGTICAGGFNGCPNGTRNLLDFMDATVDAQGRVLAGFADGCVDACVIGPPNSFTAVATIARQVSGRRLFARFDQLAPPSAPAVEAKAVTGPPAANVITWQEPDDHGSAITGYRVYRRSGGGASTLLASPDASARQYTDSAVPSGVASTYRVTAVNAQGEGASCSEIAPTAGPPPSTASPCDEGGVPVLTDPAGDALDRDPGHDVQSLSIAEPRSLGAGKIAFILKVASLESLPKNTVWPVLFKAAGADHWVRMRTDALGTVSFGFGNGTSYTGTQVGAADPASGWKPDGTIRIVVTRAAIGDPAVGSALTEFLTRVSVSAVAASLTPDNMPDSLGRAGTYTVSGSENCAAPQPDLAVTPNDVATWVQKGPGGPQIVIAATIHNIGTAEAANARVSIAVDGQQVGILQTIGRIAPGGFGRASAIWNAKGTGDHTITVVADPSNAIAELKEDNNRADKPVAVKGGKLGP